jgi:two-component system, NarL family, sensor histidine kinase DegS
MSSADGQAPADLSAILRATEQQLLAGCERCRALAAAHTGSAVVKAGANGGTADHYAAGRSAAADGAPEQVHQLAAELRDLATRLLGQADALSAAVGDPSSGEGGATAPRLQASEAERARLARDLHDGPAQYFANAIFETEYLHKLLTRDPAAVGEGLGRLRQALQQGVQEIRQCLFDLRLPATEDPGVVAMLGGYLPEYERQYGIAAQASLPDDELPLSADQAIAIFRVMQEALTNARKHSGAEQVQVKLQRRDGEVVLQVEDDGRGFAPEHTPPGHYGLVGMRERAQLVGGHLEIHGRPGKGTRVVLRVPLDDQASGAE